MVLCALLLLQACTNAVDIDTQKIITPLDTAKTDTIQIPKPFLGKLNAATVLYNDSASQRDWEFSEDSYVQFHTSSSRTSIILKATLIGKDIRANSWEHTIDTIGIITPEITTLGSFTALNRTSTISNQEFKLAFTSNTQGSKGTFSLNPEYSATTPAAMCSITQKGELYTATITFLVTSDFLKKRFRKPFTGFSSTTTIVFSK